MIKHSFLVLVIIFSIIILSACSDYKTEDYYYLEDRVDELEFSNEDLESENESLRETIEYYKRFLRGVYYKSLEDNYVHQLDCYNIQDDEYYYDCIDSPSYYVEDLELSGDYTFKSIYKNNAHAFLDKNHDDEAEELIFVQPNDNYYHKLICDKLVDPNAWTRITASNRGYEKCPICFGN